MMHTERYIGWNESVFCCIIYHDTVEEDSETFGRSQVREK